MCGEHMKLRIREHDICESVILNEDHWYKIDFIPQNKTHSIDYNTVYVWAKNKKNGGKHQAEEIFYSAVNGNYTGRNKEQSFFRDVADDLYNCNAKIVSTNEFLNEPPEDSKILSRTDKGMRAEAHKEFDKNLLSLLGDNSSKLYQPETYRKLQADLNRGFKYLIHHENNFEKDDKLQNLKIITYKDNVGLRAANGIHSFIHGITCNGSKPVVPQKYTAYLYDFSVNPATRFKINIDIS